MRVFFRFVTAHPLPFLIGPALLAAAFAPFVLTLARDTSPDAFIPATHEALALKKEVDAQFGLSDPIAVAVVRDQPGGVFNPSTLRLIQSLTQRIQDFPDIEPGDVMSLATESGVFFEDGQPGFRRFLTDIPETPHDLTALKNDILGYELYRGTLVSADASAACILIRPRDEHRADAIYRALRQAVDETPVNDERLFVAGEAAVRAHMGTAVSDDALRMNFVCPVVMAVLIILAYRTVRGTLLPLCVIGGASVLALGSMGAVGVPVYIVTNGIFVVIMALAVADSLHLIGQYYEEQLQPNGRTKQDLIVDACSTLWYPILMTSLTDLAGFLALYLVGAMPPIEYFGLFTCVGIVGALVYSCTVVPAGLAIRPLALSAAFLARRAPTDSPGHHDLIGRALAALGTTVFHRRRAVLVAGGVVLAFAGWAASKLVINDARILAFKDRHPIVQASTVLNERFDGTGQLSIALSANRPGALLDPSVLARIADLEAFTETLPHVGGTHSLAGWVKRAHQKMHDDDPAYYAIPEDPEDTRFYLDVLSERTSPMARSLAEIVDRDYTHTNLIVRMRSTEFIHQRAVIETLQQYLANRITTDSHTGSTTTPPPPAGEGRVRGDASTNPPPATPLPLGGEGRVRGDASTTQPLSAHLPAGTAPAPASLTARLTGRAHLDYHWLRLIRSTHFNSMGLSLLCVLALTALMFRSLLAGLLCTLTVSVAVLVNYAVMGLSGIPLGVGSSMFASIAIGTGVNAPIHMLDRLRAGLRRPGADAAAVFRDATAYTGRVLFFTGTIIAIGFLLLCVSQFRTLNEFGLLIGLAMLISFITSITLLPAAVVAARPRFIWGMHNRGPDQPSSASTAGAMPTPAQGGGGHALRLPLVLGFSLILLGALPRTARAADPPPFEFTDVTTTAGIDFVETIGDDEMTNIVESTGVGCGFIDFDGDGWLDIYLINGCWLEGISDAGLAPDRRAQLARATDRLYRNRRDGTFEDVTAAAGVNRPASGMGVTAADYDGDGDQDLYITNYGPNFLYRNNGDGTSTEIGRAAGVDDPNFGVGAVFLDFDRDGWLDLYLGNYLTFDPSRTPEHARHIVRSPLAYDAQQDRLFRNLGPTGNPPFSFRDVTHQAGINAVPPGRAMGVGAFDYDNDGWLDVFVSNDAMENHLWHNKRDGTFENVALLAGVAFSEAGAGAAAMAVEVGDIDGDGLSDLLIPDMNTCCLYRNLGRGLFEDVAVRSGIGAAVAPYHSWGGVLADFDLDGHLDAFIANGDATRLGPPASLFFHGDGRGRFEPVPPAKSSASLPPFVSRGVARGDYDNDGDIDLIVNCLNSRPLLLRNDTPRQGRHWLCVHLLGSGGNRDAIGAMVKVTAGGRTLVQQRLAAGSYLSQHDPRLHFGLGTATHAERIEVTWPDGSQKTLSNVPTDRVVAEPQPGQPASTGSPDSPTPRHP